MLVYFRRQKPFGHLLQQPFGIAPVSFPLSLRPCAPVNSHDVDRFKHDQIQWQLRYLARGKANHEVPTAPPRRAHELFGKAPSRNVQDNIRAPVIRKIAYGQFLSTAE